MRRRGLFDRLRWHVVTGDLDYAAAGDTGYLHVHRGRWRRPIEVVVPRDELLDLARCIVDMHDEDPSLTHGLDT